MPQFGTDDSLHQTIACTQAAAEQMVEGNGAPWKELCSHRDDATIAGAWGGYEHG